MRCPSPGSIPLLTAPLTSLVIDLSGVHVLASLLGDFFFLFVSRGMHDGQPVFRPIIYFLSHRLPQACSASALIQSAFFIVDSMAFRHRCLTGGIMPTSRGRSLIQAALSSRVIYPSEYYASLSSSITRCVVL